MNCDAVLLLAHGTPSRVEEVPEYMQRLTGGRALPQEVLDEVAHRFSAVGGSPLTHLTLEQGRLLAESIGKPVYVGMRNWNPSIAETVEQMVANGIERAKVICLAPQNSRTSVGLYRKAFDVASRGRVAADFVETWFDHPDLIAAFAESLAATRAHMQNAPVLFTAHSVPCRTIQGGPETDTPPPIVDVSIDGDRRLASGDPYSVQSKSTAALVANACNVEHWYFAFQSQGMSGGTWIGPTVESTIDALYAEGVRELIIHPIGFVCDHVEILYDIDVQFREQAEALGMKLLRPQSLNTSPRFIAALADLARR
jgi:ferrochelatase